MREKCSVMIPGGDEIHLEFELDGENICRPQLKFVGCPELAARVAEWRPKLTGPLNKVPIPRGSSHADMLLREVLQKACKAWTEIKPNKIVCVCNKLTARDVDAAILRGSTSVKMLQKSTLSGISCTYCHEELNEMLLRRCPNIV